MCRESAAVDPFVDTIIEYGGQSTNLGAGDFNVIRDFGHLHFLSGESNKQVCSRMDDHSAIVSETFAIRRNVSLGDRLVLKTATGPSSFTVKGIYYDYASDLGYILIPLPMYRQCFHDQTISNCAIYLLAGADANQVRSEIERRVGISSQLSIRTTGELRREAMRIFDRTFSITYALHTIAIVVSMLAVINVLFALTLESRREFGILRYLGATESQLQKIVLIEAGILGVIGNFFGVILGFILSLLLIFVINKQSFGWTVQLYLPADFLVQSTLLVVATAILAGIIPARLAARTLAPSVVRDE